MRNQVLNYRANLSANREIFLLNFREELQAFSETNTHLHNISQVVSTTRTHRGDSLIGHIPLLMIMNRQMLNAFEAMAVFQSYQSWILLRPGLESALIMGKWIDSPKNADIWKNREKDKRTYQKVYSGKGLLSNSLPDCQAIRGVLIRVNDDFMHTNTRYYFRHTQISDVDASSILLKLQFNDEETVHKAHLYAFVHLTRFLVQSIGRMFAAEFGVRPELNADLGKVQNHFRQRVAALAQEQPHTTPVLTELGLWPASFLAKEKC